MTESRKNGDFWNHFPIKKLQSTTTKKLNDWKGICIFSNRTNKRETNTNQVVQPGGQNLTWQERRTWSATVNLVVAECSQSSLVFLAHLEDKDVIFTLLEDNQNWVLSWHQLGFGWSSIWHHVLISGPLSLPAPQQPIYLVGAGLGLLIQNIQTRLWEEISEWGKSICLTWLLWLPPPNLLDCWWVWICLLCPHPNEKRWD